MKITFVGINYSPEPTGIAVYTAGLAAGLQARGHAVKAITGFPHYPEWKIREDYKGLSKRELITGVTVERVRHTVPRAPSALGRIKMEISFALAVLSRKLESPDVIVCISPSLFSVSAVTLLNKFRFRRAPIVTWVQDIYSAGVTETGSFNSVLVHLTRALEGAALRHSDGVVVIHDRFAQYIERELKVRKEVVTTIRNWSHVDRTPIGDRQAVRAEFGWTDRDVIALHAGNMGAKQHLENVVSAAAEATRIGSAVKFVLLGDGNQKARLKILAENVENIEFIEPLEDAHFKSILQASDVLLVNEGTDVIDMAVPSKLTTYFAAGRPVIAATDTRSVTANEIRASGGGVVIEPGRPVELLRSVERLAAAPDRCSKFAQSGVEFAKHVLSAEHAIDQFEKLLETISKPKFTQSTRI